ncbi:MAG: hypothetical protein ACRENG_16545 [bacterium]
MPRRRRSREDQITIDVLRYRVDYPGAVIEHDDGAAYSDAFTSFLLNRYEMERHKLTRRKFARAAEIPVATLRVWVAQAPRPLLAALELEELAKNPPPAPGLLKMLADRVAKSAGAAIAALIRGLKDPRLIIRQIRLALASTAHFLTWFFVAERIDFLDFRRSELKRHPQTRVAFGLICAIFFNFGILATFMYLNRDKAQVRQVMVQLVNYPELEPAKEEEPAKRKKSNSEHALNITTETDNLVNVQVRPDDLPSMITASDLPADASATDVPVVDVSDLLSHQTGIAPNGGGTSGIPLSSNIVAKKGAPDIDIGVGGFGGSSGGNGIGNGPVAPPTLKLPQGTGGMNGLPVGPNLAASSGGRSGGPSGGGYSSGRAGAITGKKVVNSKAEKITTKNFGEADLKRDLRQIFQELATWMQSNRYEFTPVLKSYMHYKPGDVTSRVGIEVGTTAYDLFMLCNEASEDFGLLLVVAGDSAQATCLRDTGFRQQSFFLSKGIAGRDEENEVNTISMLEERPTRQETDRFYNIFLSWWKMNKTGAQN